MDYSNHLIRRKFINTAENMVNAEVLTEVQKKIFETIPKGDVGELKTLLAQLQGTADFVDENGMTPLQHACYKGNTELVQTLLDQVN